MPYAVKFQGSGFLRKVVAPPTSTTPRSRRPQGSNCYRVVDAVDEATLYDHPEHAERALKAARGRGDLVQARPVVALTAAVVSVNVAVGQTVKIVQG